jgi:cell volume regulation protein A
LILAFIANRVYRLTRIPDPVVLMALGVLLGPVLGLLNAAKLAQTTNLLGTLAIILVLFEGGLELDIKDTVRHFRGSLLLALVAYVFSVGLVMVVVCKGLGLSWTSGLLVGAALGCTSSTVVLPVLQQMKTEEPVRITLMLEASWGDVLAVLTVGLVLGMQGHNGPIASGLAHGVLMQVFVALLFGLAAGVLWSRLLPTLSEQRFWQVLTFSVVLVLYAGMEALHANGLISVLAFGLTLANFPGMDPMLRRQLETDSSQPHQALLTFHSELAFLVRTFFFVLIGAVAELATFRQHPLLMAGTLGALFLARWLAIHASRWSWHGISDGGRELIMWMLPRGLITIVLSLQVVQARGEELSFLPGLAFAVILATNLLLILGSVRAAAQTPAEPETIELQLFAKPAENQKVAPEARRRWVLDSSLLVLLALGAALLWYSQQPPELRQTWIGQWLAQHWHR